MVEHQYLRLHHLCPINYYKPNGFTESCRPEELEIISLLSTAFFYEHVCIPLTKYQSEVIENVTIHLTSEGNRKYNYLLQRVNKMEFASSTNTKLLLFHLMSACSFYFLHTSIPRHPSQPPPQRQPHLLQHFSYECINRSICPIKQSIIIILESS